MNKINGKKRYVFFCKGNVIVYTKLKFINKNSSKKMILTMWWRVWNIHFIEKISWKQDVTSEETSIKKIYLIFFFCMIQSSKCCCPFRKKYKPKCRQNCPFNANKSIAPEKHSFVGRCTCHWQNFTQRNVRDLVWFFFSRSVPLFHWWLVK